MERMYVKLEGFIVGLEMRRLTIYLINTVEINLFPILVFLAFVWKRMKTHFAYIPRGNGKYIPQNKIMRTQQHKNPNMHQLLFHSH